MFGICRIEYLENIYRFQDSKDPKMHKKLPQFAFYNYKTKNFILEDYNNFKSYSDLQIWSKQQLADLSSVKRRLNRQRSKSEGSS